MLRSHSRVVIAHDCTPGLRRGCHFISATEFNMTTTVAFSQATPSHEQQKYLCLSVA
jgi:hypothetical protein